MLTDWHAGKDTQRERLVVDTEEFLGLRQLASTVITHDRIRA